jgi:hypothetical protein
VLGKVVWVRYRVGLNYALLFLLGFNTPDLFTPIARVYIYSTLLQSYF